MRSGTEMTVSPEERARQDGEPVNGSDAQVTVRLHTRLPEMLVVPDKPFTIPANTNRYGLSQVVNHLLELSPPRPFDFLVNGQLLRASLAHIVAAQQLSAEGTIDVEYVLAVLPPKPRTAFETDDWVGCLHISHGVLATGSYDGSLRLWGSAHLAQGPEGHHSEHCTTTEAHQGPVTALTHCQLAASGSSSTAEQCSSSAPACTTADLSPQFSMQELEMVSDLVAVGQQSVLVSGGKDGALWVWHLPMQKLASYKAGLLPSSAAAVLDEAACTDGLQAAAQLLGQTASVGGLAGDPSGGQRCIAGGWDGSVRLWQLPTLAPAVTASTGGKAAKRKAVAREAAPSNAPAVDLPAHTDNVACIAWPSPNTVISGSWDHSVRLTDLNTAQTADVYHGSKAVYTLAPQPSGGNLIAFGGADNAVRLWDPRASGAQGSRAGAQALISHKHWVAGVAWRPGSSHQLASVSHDCTLKLWDTRTDIPLHTVEAHTDKVLCVGWVDSKRVVTGGADKQVRTYEMTALELA